MQIITDVNKFNSERLILVTNAKQAWEHATLLAVSAVMHYQSDKDAKDSSWIESLMNSFLECDSRMCQAFEAFVKASTNVKFRQDETDLDKALTTKIVGVSPSNYSEVIELVKVQGLNRFAKIKTKSKAQALRWNNDFNKVDKPKASSSADVVSLQTTEVGKSLVEASKAAASLDDAGKAKALDLAKQYEAAIASIAAGHDAPALSVPSDEISPAFASYIEDTLSKVVEVYKVRGEEKAMKMVQSLNKTADDSLKAAMLKLASGAN